MSDAELAARLKGGKKAPRKTYVVESQLKAKQEGAPMFTS